MSSAALVSSAMAASSTSMQIRLMRSSLTSHRPVHFSHRRGICSATVNAPQHLHPYVLILVLLASYFGPCTSFYHLLAQVMALYGLVVIGRADRDPRGGREHSSGKYDCGSHLTVSNTLRRL